MHMKLGFSLTHQKSVKFDVNPTIVVCVVISCVGMGVTWSRILAS